TSTRTATSPAGTTISQKSGPVPRSSPMARGVPAARSRCQRRRQAAAPAGRRRILPAEWPPASWRAAARMTRMDDLDRRLLNQMQNDFPLVERPFLALAEQVGVSEA